MSRWRAVRLVAMREILERGRSRGYVLSLVFTLLLLVGGFVLPQLLLADQATRLALVEPVPAGLETAVQAGAAAYDLDLEISSIPDRAAAVAALEGGTINAALAVPADLSAPGELIVLERASDQLQAVASAAVVSLRAADVAPLLVPPTITALEPPTEEDITALIFANAGIILMFIGIFSYGTWVLTGVVEEKQSRVVEVVLSTVRPRDLLVGKVLGIGLLALVQIVILVAAGIAAAQISGRLTLPPTTVGAVVQLLVWFILGFALYSTAMGFLGSLASRDGGGVQRLDAGHDDRDGVLPGVDPPRHAGPRWRPGHGDDVLPARRADGGSAAGRAGGDRAVGDGAVHRPDAGRDLGHVRRGGPRLRGRHPPDGQPDPDPRRLARPQLSRGRQPAWTSDQRKHAVSWSFTRPADCISA